MYAETFAPFTAPAERVEEQVEPLERILRLLDDRDWHPSLVAEWLGEATAWADRLRPERRTDWLAGLRQCWHRHGWALGVESRVGLIGLAARWDDWPLVVGVGEAMAAEGELPDESRLLLAHAWRQLGDAPSATDHARSYLLAHPRCEAGLREYAAIEQWREFRAAFGLDDAPIDDEDGLFLEPLVHHHREGFAWQYFDPTIAELCCLPHFEDDGHWHRWLDEGYGYGDQLSFAVLHRDWGFVGVVSLILHDGVGFFYYWIGPDFQGQGLGPRAAALMLREAAERWGLTRCYAKVFHHNEPSRRALAKLGFEPLDFRPAPPNQEERFYRIGPPVERQRAIAELSTLFDRMGSETRVAAPLATVATADRTHGR